MPNVYHYSHNIEALSVRTVRVDGGYGLGIGTNPGGCLLPDDEIPNLISALQDYMSRRARETVAMDKLRAVREYREKWS